MKIFKPGKTCEHHWGPCGGGIGAKEDMGNRTGITNYNGRDRILKLLIK